MKATDVRQSTPGTRKPDVAGWGIPTAPRRRILPILAASPLRTLVAATLMPMLFVLMPHAAQASISAPAVASLGAFANPLREPTRVAVDTAGRIYTTDPASGKVSVLDAFGRPLEVHSGYAKPLAIAVDATGNIYLSEEGNGSVSVLDSQWNLLSKFGAGAGEFVLPSHIALDPLAANTVYVCDSRANQIKVYADGQPAFSFGGLGTGDGQFDFPAGVFASTDGEVFVVDQNNDRVEVFDRKGAFLRAFALKTTGGMSMGISGRAQGITGDSQGRLYIADSFQGLIKVFSRDGTFLSTLGGYGDAAGQLRSPAGVAIDALGRLLVASVNNSRVELLGLDSYVQLSTMPARQVVAAGTDVSFSATVSGTGSFTYQWLRGGNALQDGGNITGSTSPKLTIAGAAVTDSGAYSVIVVGPGGTFTSPTASLTVMSPPSFVSPPASYTVLSGTAVHLQAAVAGSNLSFQWQLNGANITGANAPSLSIYNAAQQNAGHYTLVVTNALGSVVSNAADLNVIIAPNPPQFVSLAPLAIDGMHILFNGDPGFNFTVEGSTDLIDWTPLGTVVGDSAPVEYVDTDATTLQGRFYRVHWAP